MRKVGINFRQKKDGALVPRRVSVVLVLVCVVIVAVNVVGVLFFRNDMLVKRKMEGMARDYYENYYYDKIEPARLEDHASRGLPEVSLRTLLNYDGAKNAGEAGYFKRSECSTAKTTVTYYPVEPFGRTDYELEIKYSCNFE